jgi:glutathione S-transferase
MLAAMTLEYVDLETAKAARGTRIVVNAIVPSPWSEALKGCLAVAGVPALAVRRAVDNAAIDAWTGVDNAPAVFHEREPIRTSWSAIVPLVDRIGGTRILPAGLAERAGVIGTLDAIAGEGGIGWNARLAMIDAGITSGGTVGFPPQVAKYLARRYGYSPEAVAAARERITAQLAFVADQLRGAYFGGATPNAVDIYSATFLTPVAAPITEAECPDMLPPLRAAFASAHAAFGALVPRALLDHRERMFESHLPRPIRL